MKIIGWEGPVTVIWNIRFSICIWGLGRKLTLCESTTHWLPAQNPWLLNYSTGLSDIIQLLVLMITMIMMMMMIILFSEAELAKVGDYNLLK